MKGIIIYEDYRGKEVVEAIKLDAVNYECKSDTSDGSWINNLSGVRKESTQARCNKDDEYDFEVGALISLMKMCGVEKVKKAANETFFDVAENSVNEYEEKIHALEEEKEQIIVAKNVLYNKLKEENEKLNYEYNLVKAGHDYWKEQYKELKESDKYAKSEVGRLSLEKHRLEEENKMLCDKIKFLDKENRNLIYGGRQNGKQYTFLVDLFKKLDQKKVDAAYKEAYNTKLPLWQKEVLNQMYGIYKESKEKTVQIKGFNINIKPSTKREQMWNDILACDCEHSKYVKVKKEDLQTFAKEYNEKKIFSIIGYEFHAQEWWFADDSCIFQIFRKPAGFICAKCVCFASEDTIIDYLPPMRWDLFKKGRLAVGCTEEEVPEFIEKVKRELGNIRIEKYSIENLHCNGPIKVYYHYDKDTNWLKPLLVSGIPRVKVNNHKVYYWEDVR